MTALLINEFCINISQGRLSNHFIKKIGRLFFMVLCLMLILNITINPSRQLNRCVYFTILLFVPPFQVCCLRVILL